MTLDKTATANYSTMSDLSSNVPKVRLHDTMLNIKSKTGHEEVPPTRREQSRMLSTTNKFNTVAINFEKKKCMRKVTYHCTYDRAF